MLSEVVQPQGQMVTTSSNQSLVSAYAVKQSANQITVLLINKDPSNTYQVSLSWSGFSPGPDPTVYFYGENSSSISVSQDPGMPPDDTQTLSPYSLTTLVVSTNG